MFDCFYDYVPNLRLFYGAGRVQESVKNSSTLHVKCRE